MSDWNRDEWPAERRALSAAGSGWAMLWTLHRIAVVLDTEARTGRTHSARTI